VQIRAEEVDARRLVDEHLRELCACDLVARHLPRRRHTTQAGDVAILEREGEVVAGLVDVDQAEAMVADVKIRALIQRTGLQQQTATVTGGNRQRRGFLDRPFDLDVGHDAEEVGSEREPVVEQVADLIGAERHIRRLRGLQDA
jgi:hypothetical protein